MRAPSVHAEGAEHQRWAGEHEKGAGPHQGAERRQWPGAGGVCRAHALKSCKGGGGGGGAFELPGGLPMGAEPSLGEGPALLVSCELWAAAPMLVWAGCAVLDAGAWAPGADVRCDTGSSKVVRALAGRQPLREGGQPLRKGGPSPLARAGRDQVGRKGLGAWACWAAAEATGGPP